jgi:hypothetical protein
MSLCRSVPLVAIYRTNIPRFCLVFVRVSRLQLFMRRMSCLQTEGTNFVSRIFCFRISSRVVMHVVGQPASDSDWMKTIRPAWMWQDKGPILHHCQVHARGCTTRQVKFDLPLPSNATRLMLRVYPRIRDLTMESRFHGYYD